MKLSNKEFVILGLLDKKEMFGLELIKESSGELKRGTIYVTLQRMAEKGHIESRPEQRPKPEIGIPRRIYSATEGGRKLFTLESQYRVALEETKE